MKNTEVCALLSYLVIGLLWYAADKKMQKDTFCKYHVKQGLVLLLFSIAWSIVLGIVLPLFAVLFFIFWVWILLRWVPLVLAILGIINVVNEEKKQLPIIGQYAKIFKF